jgi:mono/diheme cytochrome c family protein
MKHVLSFGLVLSSLLVAACATNEMPAASEGEPLFNNNCAACHGYDATGGELVAGQVAPNLTRISARNDGVFPRARVLSKIDGYGHGKAPARIMPEFGSLLEGDLVPVEVDGTLTPTPRPLAALLAYLESIQTP